MKKVGYPIGCLIDGQSSRQLRVLGRDAYWTTPGVTVVAVVRFGSQLVIVFQVNRLVAVQCDQQSRSQVDGIGSRAMALAASAPLRIPPAMINWTSP